MLETPWVNAAYNVAWSGERYRLPQNKESNLIDAYADHSVSLYRVFQFKGHKLRLQVDAANLGRTMRWYMLLPHARTEFQSGDNIFIINF